MKAKITQVGQADLNEAAASITLSEGLYTLSVAGEPIATCKRARSLSDYAFTRGALSVTHAYDLREASDE